MYIDNRMFLACHVTHVDPYLAVLNFAQSAAPLLADAHRLGSFLGKPRGVEHDHAIGFTQLLADLARQSGEHRLMIPRHKPDELLDSLSLLIMQVGDPLACLAFQSRHQAGHVLNRMPFL